MRFRGSASVPGPSLADIRHLDTCDLAGEIQRTQAIDLIRRALADQSRLHIEDRNDELEDLCLDLINVLRPDVWALQSAPGISGRS